MAVTYEKAVIEDLNLGFGGVTVTNPAGGTLSGNKINLGGFLTTFTVSFSATPIFDLANGDLQTITLTADVTSSTISLTGGTVKAGAILILRIIQDATGGRLFNWPTNVLGAGTYPISTVANDITRVTLQYNGTNWEFVCPPTIFQ